MRVPLDINRAEQLPERSEYMLTFPGIVNILSKGIIWNKSILNSYPFIASSVTSYLLGKIKN